MEWGGAGDTHHGVSSSISQLLAPQLSLAAPLWSVAAMATSSVWPRSKCGPGCVSSPLGFILAWSPLLNCFCGSTMPGVTGGSFLELCIWNLSCPTGNLVSLMMPGPRSRGVKGCL